MAQTIGSAIREWLREKGLDTQLKEHSAPGYWPEIVGPALARHTIVERIHNGVLFIGVENAAWRTEVMLRREEIRERMNERLGAAVIKEIVVR